MIPPTSQNNAYDSFCVTIVGHPKHGILYAASKHYGGIKKLAEFIGISGSCVCWWVNLRNYPRHAFNSTSAGQRARERERCETALALIGTSLDECWPPEVRQFIDNSRELKSLVFEQTQEVPLERLTGPVMQSLTVDGGAERHAEANELKERIAKVIKTLNPQEREVINCRYAADGGKCLTLKETGDVLRVSPERIRQIEARAIRKLQQPNRAGLLVEFLDEKATE